MREKKTIRIQFIHYINAPKISEKNANNTNLQSLKLLYVCLILLNTKLNVNQCKLKYMNIFKGKKIQNENYYFCSKLCFQNIRLTINESILHACKAINAIRQKRLTNFIIITVNSLYLYT